MPNSSHRPLSLDELQQLAQHIIVPYVPVQQLTDDERRRLRELYAEANERMNAPLIDIATEEDTRLVLSNNSDPPEGMHEEIETWREVGDTGVDTLMGIAAAAAMMVGFGLLGVVGIATVLLQDPREQRERQPATESRRRARVARRGWTPGREDGCRARDESRRQNGREDTTVEKDRPGEGATVIHRDSGEGGDVSNGRGDRRGQVGRTDRGTTARRRRE